MWKSAGAARENGPSSFWGCSKLALANPLHRVDELADLVEVVGAELAYELDGGRDQTLGATLRRDRALDQRADVGTSCGSSEDDDRTFALGHGRGRL
jgi:hypothetical protein